MKKRLRVVLLIMLVIIWNMANISVAANEQVTLSTSKKNVKSGETFEITVSQESEGITGFESTLIYDTSLFTLTKKETLNGWIDIGNDKKLDAMANSQISSGDVFKLTFSVKENASVTTSQIRLTDVKLYKNSSERMNFGNLSISINVNSTSGDNNNDDNNNGESATLSKIEVTKAPDKVNYKEGERFNPAGMEITATYGDNSLKKVTNYTYSPNTELKPENKLITISYEENGVAKATTQAINVTSANNGDNNNDNENNNNNNNNNTQPELAGINLDKSNLTLVLGVTTRMNLIVYANPSNAILPEIVWSTSNEEVAKLESTDTNGSITVVPVAAGKATITARTRDGKYSATTEVTVNANGNASGNTSNATNDTTISGRAVNAEDNTTKSGILPKAGAKATYILLAVAGLIGVGVVSYRGYKKYKGI